MVKSATASAPKTAKKAVTATPEATKPVKKATKPASKPATTPAKPVAKPVKTTKANNKTAEVSHPILSPLNLIKVWFDGWKKTLDLKGRSSRFELWTFLLLNTILMVIIQLKCSYYMSERFLVSANANGMSIAQIENYITFAEIGFYLSLFVPLFPLVSLIVRRMHDLDKLAWPNYFEPLFMGTVVMSVLLVALLELSGTDYQYTALMLSICFVTLLYSVGYYSLKVLIMTMFYRGNTKANEYGAPAFNDDAHEEQALKLSCFYFLLIITIGLLYLTLALVQ